MTVDATPPEAVGATTSGDLLPAPPVAAAPEQGVSRSNLAPPTTMAAPTYGAPTYTAAPTYDAPSATVYDDTPGRGRPPSTFGAQAANLGQPVRQPAPQQVPPQQVAAPVTAPAAQPAAPTVAPAQTTTTARSLATADTVRFLPIIGAPSDKLEALSARLGDTARAAGLTIMPMDDDAAALSLKGYFSAVQQDGVVSVVYVWDVLGADGVRLNRIQGNEASDDASFTGSDPWAGVSDRMMASIGQKTIGQLLAWLDTQG